MYKFTHANAATIGEATTALGKGKTQVIAGGTDLLTYMKGMCSPNPPTTLVNLKNIAPSLDYIKVDGTTLKIGSLTSLADIAASTVVSGGWNVLAQAARAAARCAHRQAGAFTRTALASRRRLQA